MESLYKTAYRFNGVHHCDAVVIACMDFRFWEETVEFVKNHLKIEAFDFPKFPGSAKAINETGEGELPDYSVKVACDLHHAGMIVIVNHSDCGAYGGSSKFSSREEEAAFHAQELKKAGDILTGRYPGKKIVLVYAQTTEDGKEVEFFEVK